MGLSAPLALLAAALVALPIIAHLIRRADVERRVLPTVALLRRVVVRDRRRARVTEPWLLALRLAAVLAAVLALAGPFVVDRLAYGDGSALSIVIVLDDSASMAQRAEDGADTTALDRARERAREIVRSVGEGSEIALVLAGSPARLAVPRSSDRDAVLAGLEQVQPGARRTDVAGALALAARQLASAHLAARRVIVLSDFAFDADTPRRHGDIEVEYVSVVAPGEHANLGLTDVRASPDPLEPGAWSTTVELAGVGEGPQSVALAVLAIPAGVGVPATDAIELTRTQVALTGGHGRANLRFHPPDGITRVAFRLLDHHDASSFDDERVLALHTPRTNRVAFVEPAGQRTARFATRALSAIPDEVGGFRAQALDVDHLALRRTGQLDPDAEQRTDPLADLDVLVLAGVVPSSPSAIEAVRGFVEGGGGLLLAAGPGTRPIDVAVIADLLPARVGDVQTVAFDPAQPSVIATELALREAPGPTGLESTLVRARVGLDAAEADVRLRLQDGTPLLVHDVASRRAVLAVGLDDQMSDLPLRVGFLPMLASLAHELSRPGALPDRPFVAGEAPALRVEAGIETVEIVTPTGQVRSRPIQRGSVTLDDLAQPGAYTLRVATEGGMRELERATLVIVPPADEIDLTSRVPQSAGAEATLHDDGESRVPIERWAYLLVGLLAAIEGFARLGSSRPRLSRA